MLRLRKSILSFKDWNIIQRFRVETDERDAKLLYIMYCHQIARTKIDNNFSEDRSIRPIKPRVFSVYSGYLFIQKHCKRNWKFSNVRYADDIALVADTEIALVTDTDVWLQNVVTSIQRICCSKLLSYTV